MTKNPSNYLTYTDLDYVDNHLKKITDELDQVLNKLNSYIQDDKIEIQRYYNK